MAERRKMIEAISAHGLDDQEVLDVLARVPRHEFVNPEDIDFAYRDQPVPIGEGQTISQPLMVATMTSLAEVGADDSVLEIGTGSGYQAAVLAEMAREVVSVEIIGTHAKNAADRLKRLGYENISVIHGDGYFGWEEGAPYDAVIVTAAPEKIPQALIDQLAPGGRLVIPLGKSGWTQNLLLVRKDLDGNLEARKKESVRFVPFTRDKR